MTLVCQTSAGDGYDDMEYAVLTLSFEDITSLLQMISVAALFKQIDSTFHRAGFFKGYVTYHSSWRGDSDESDELAELLDQCEEEISNSEWSILPQGYEVSTDEARVDAATVNVDEESVLFAAYSHHGGGTEVETQPLPREALLLLGKALMRLKVDKAIQTTPRRTRIIDID